MITTCAKNNKIIVSVLLIGLLISFFVAVPAYGEEEAGVPFLYGDVNNDGKIDIADAILILRHIVALANLEEGDYAHAQYAAEVSANNEIDVFDAIFLLRRVVGLIEEGDFPAEIRLADAEKIVVKAIESDSSDLDLIREAIEILLPPIPPRDNLESCLDVLEDILAAEESESLDDVAEVQALIDELPDGEAKDALQARLDDLKAEIEGIGIEGVAVVGVTLEAMPVPEEATGDYQWLRADSEDGEYEEIAGATDDIYTLTDEDVDKFIKVTIEGTGAYKGTATSEAIGPIETPIVVEATWEATGRTGYNTVGGTAYVFQEYELKDAEGERVSLHVDNIKSITSNGKELTPNTDHTLWFNVLAAAGEREFVVIDNDHVIYTATLIWVEPTEITATAEGDVAYNKVRGAYYQKYNVDIDLLEFDAMFQIKPESGNISKLTPSGNDCLWFKVGDDDEDWAQEEGGHIFLVKHDDIWSKFVVDYEALKIEGLDVEARDDNQLDLGELVEDDGAYTLDIELSVEMNEYENGIGETGKWVGLQLLPTGVTDITELQYETAKSDGFKSLTAADAAEAGAEGQIVWWVDAGTADEQWIKLRYAGGENPAIKLTVTFIPS